MKPKLLFVDDDLNILTSYELSLRPMRQKWDMSFALCGEDALAILAKAPHDVVVSDMRMPGMDGLALLKEVKRLYPDTVRIILSGYADEAGTLKAAEVTLQCLSKPCRHVDFIRLVEEALRLRASLVSPESTAGGPGRSDVDFELQCQGISN